MKQIAMTFKPDGSVQITPTGFEGSTCYDATRPYEAGQGLNLQSTPTTETNEVSQKETVVQTQKVR